MKISVVTLFPEMISPFFKESIVKKAQEKKLVEIELINLRDYAIDDYGTVDDRPYGGGAGMIMRVDVMHRALSKISNFQFPISKQISNFKKPNSKTILTTPRGKRFDQQSARGYSHLDNLIIIAGHYEGIDERAADLIDDEVSLGDFVLTGGEIVAAAIVDAVVRLIPGVLKKGEAIQEESFLTISVDRLIEIIGRDEELVKVKARGIKNVSLLEYPHYTRPETFHNKKVPEILLSGDPKKIMGWRMKRAFELTLRRRPDLLTDSRS